MPTNISDQSQRFQALDVSQSFIIQAPAGSGKTELLTQRFLKLLAIVNEPEEILAITFTNKAVAEMQARIINALSYAKDSVPPQETHLKTTYLFAQSALKRSNERNWNLLNNPARLRIMTIDALCLRLSEQLPAQSKLGPHLRISQQPEKLYLSAAQSLMDDIGQEHDPRKPLSTLLLHCDNNIDRVNSLIVTMLAKRDQWLSYTLMQHADSDLRSYLEEELLYTNTMLLENLSQSIPERFHNQLNILATFAADNVSADNAIAPLQSGLCYQTINVEHKSIWLGLCDLLLSKNNQWRKKLTKANGFPAPSSANTKEQKASYAEHKSQMQALLEALQQTPELHQSLIALRHAPSLHYSDQQWHILEALLSLLPLAAAKLKILFSQFAQIDYIENSLAALLALGTEQQPTDLTLSLDHCISHLLVDEFQDTSLSQYRLLTKITQGFEPTDGRTVFLVGDPMQSIYRFRQAEVGLFLKTKAEGLGNIHLESITLCSNFRSTQTIVNWNNILFQQVFPDKDQMADSCVSYTKSLAIDNSKQQQSTFCHSYEEHSQEANHIAKQINQLRLEHPDLSIAVLVRSRRSLEYIAPTLSAQDIPFVALDIEKLSTRPIIQDLLALTKALYHLADRTAWLSLLRAPYCGLSLADLLLIANHQSPIIYQAMQDNELQQQLSADGEKRLKHVLASLHVPLENIQRYNLRDYISLCFNNLYQKHYRFHREHENIESFLTLLELFDANPQINITTDLDDMVERLFANAQSHADNPVQLMTIHRAKGLEFDVVFLPGLGRRGANDEKQLLKWIEFPDANELNHLLLAPITQRNQFEATYQYICFQQQIKENYERMRLLYVAATRAKKSLYLSAVLRTGTDNKITKPGSLSLLAIIWPYINMEFIHVAHEATKQPINNAKQLIHRLPIDSLNNVEKTLDCQAINNTPALCLENHWQSKLGTAIHHLIANITELGIQWWQQQSQQRYLSSLLLSFDIETENLNTAIALTIKAVSNMLQDQHGKWLLQRHQDDHCEYALSTVSNNQLVNVVIDRTFIYQDTRWIIDYKTSQNHDQTVEEFIRQEQALYQKQLALYRNVLSTLENRPTKLALYFPLLPYFQECSAFSEKEIETV